MDENINMSYKVVQITEIRCVSSEAVVLLVRVEGKLLIMWVT